MMSISVYRELYVDVNDKFAKFWIFNTTQSKL